MYESEKVNKNPLRHSDVCLLFLCFCPYWFIKVCTTSYRNHIELKKNHLLKLCPSAFAPLPFSGLRAVPFFCCLNVWNMSMIDSRRVIKLLRGDVSLQHTGWSEATRKMTPAYCSWKTKS